LSVSEAECDVSSLRCYYSIFNISMVFCHLQGTQITQNASFVRLCTERMPCPGFYSRWTAVKGRYRLRLQCNSTENRQQELDPEVWDGGPVRPRPICIPESNYKTLQTPRCVSFLH
jgi:hypothetical protein